MSSHDRLEKLPKNEYNRKSEIEAVYTQLKRSKDPRFGECSIISNKATGEKLLLKEKVVNSESEATLDIKSSKRRIEQNHEHLQQMKDYSTSMKSDFCSKYYKIRGFYEWPDHDLKTIIEERTINGESFTHQELTHIIYQIQDALCHLHKNGASFDDVRPLHIGIRREPNNYMLLDRLGDPYPAREVQTNHFISQNFIYMAPSQFRSIGERKKTVDHDPEKSDAWALGMSILEAGTMDNIQDIYNKEGNVGINELRMQEHLAEFNRKYRKDNSLLCEMVDKLLFLDEEKRLNCCTLQSQCPPYADVCAEFKTRFDTKHENSPKREEFVRKPDIRKTSEYVYKTEPVSITTNQFVQKIIEPEVIRREPIVYRQDNQYLAKFDNQNSHVIGYSGNPEIRKSIITKNPENVMRSDFSEAKVGIRRTSDTQEPSFLGSMYTSDPNKRVQEPIVRRVECGPSYNSTQQSGVRYGSGSGYVSGGQGNYVGGSNHVRTVGNTTSYVTGGSSYQTINAPRVVDRKVLEPIVRRG